MTRLRLLPVLVFSLVSLLSLKLLHLAVNAPPQSSFQARDANGGSFNRTITMAREGNPDDQIITGSVGAKKDEPAKKDGEKVAANGKPLTEDQAAVEKAKADLKAKAESEGTRIVVPPKPGSQVAQTGPSAEERALLEKLRNRRDEIDSKDRDLEIRDNLLRLSERKLDERIGELRTLEGQLGQNQGKTDTKTRYKPLVVMYESMKPKEAARVFDRLDTRILMDLVAHMNPRKVSEILAAMEPAAAEKLTIALARQAQNGDAQLAETAQAPSTELERLPAPNAPRR